MVALVADASAVGDDARWSVEGDLTRLPPMQGRAAYRIAQECLTNARQHSPGAPVEVRVGVGADEVEAEVLCGPSPATRPPDPRAALLGGSMTHAPTATGGWFLHVHLSVPPRQSSPTPPVVAAGDANTSSDELAP